MSESRLTEELDILETATQGTPIGGPTEANRTARYVVIAVQLGLSVLWLVPSLLVNLYIFGGINFPSDRFGSAYFVTGYLLAPATAILLPILALILVRKRDIGFGPVLAILAIPIIVQVGGFILYSVLTSRYGVVCC